MKPIKNLHTNYHYREVTISVPSTGTAFGVAVEDSGIGIYFKTFPEVGSSRGQWISNKHVVSFGKKYYRNSDGNVEVM